MPVIDRLIRNAAQQRVRMPWRILAQTGIYYLGNIGLVTLIRLLFLAGGELHPDLELLLWTVLSALVIGVSVWLAGRLLDRRAFAEFGFHLDRSWWLDLGFGLVLGACLMTAIFVVQVMAGWVTVVGIFRAGAVGPNFAIDLSYSLILFVAVGIYEELLFRGYRLRNLAEGLNMGWLGPRGALLLAWLISSIWFGLAHRNNPSASLVSTANLTLAGLLLGLGYLLTGELAIPIGLHITWNFFQGNVFGFPVSGTDALQTSLIAIEQGGASLWTGGAFGPEAGLLGLLAMAAGCLLTALWVWWRQGRLAIHLPLAHYVPYRNKV